tara:strand:- start:264 stop:461 length:198 start_codon:yes stop_codon:yes gene_type:complete
MKKEQIESKLLNMTMGEHKDFRMLLSTKEVIRLNKNEWEVNCFVNGWQTYYLNLKETIKYFNYER